MAGFGWKIVMTESRESARHHTQHHNLVKTHKGFKIGSQICLLRFFILTYTTASFYMRQNVRSFFVFVFAAYVYLINLINMSRRTQLCEASDEDLHCHLLGETI